MTKKWSSTAGLDGKTKRQASKDVRADARREHDRLMRDDPHYREDYDAISDIMDTIAPAPTAGQE